MSKLVFVDTVYLIALMNGRDALHSRARQLSLLEERRYITTDAVLLEVANALCRHDRRRWAIAAIRDLRSGPDVECLPVDADLFDKGFGLYCDRPDKDWSLTDCISFVVMADRSIEEALTADAHFVQAGFRALMLQEPIE